jgi:hypothetical protein
MTPKASVPKLKARQIIISQLIDAARTEVIKNDIELHFLSRLKKRIEEGKITVVRAYDVEQLRESISDANDHFVISLERLNYLKELREQSKADKIATSVEYTTPALISVEY